MERSGLRFEHFSLEVVSDLNILVWKWSKIVAQNKVCFWLILPYKSW